MLRKQPPSTVKLICAFIYSREDIYERVITFLAQKYGKIDFQSPAIDFNFTDYYEPEMGKNLTRRFISFDKLVNADRLADIKDFCIKIEKKFAPAQKRRINIDPGYINEAKLVLATTKDFHHRIYLKNGIFAEITLAYSAKEKNFTDLSTTFPDYRTKEYKEILLHIRGLYRSRLKGLTKPDA